MLALCSASNTPISILPQDLCTAAPSTSSTLPSIPHFWQITSKMLSERVSPTTPFNITHMHMHTHTLTCLHTYIHVHRDTSTQTHTRMHTLHIYTRTNIHSHAWAYSCTHSPTPMHTLLHSRTNYSSTFTLHLRPCSHHHLHTEQKLQKPWATCDAALCTP